MKRFGIAVIVSAAAYGAFGEAANAQNVVKVGWCARTVSSAAAPFAIATKMGWFEKAGIKVELIPLPGSTDCVKAVATRDVSYSLPSVEPLAIIRPQGIKAKNYYTAYQGNIYGIVVPTDSPVKKFTDLKGKRIGVTSMASAGVIIARAMASINGMDPDRDITIVVAGEAGQTAALIRGTRSTRSHNLIRNMLSQKMPAPNCDAWTKTTRVLRNSPLTDSVALEETLASKRAEAIALGQGYAKGTIFAIANPEAAIRILWEVFPQTKATGKDEATALKDDLSR